MALLWFRKGLRLHDNPSLEAACHGSRNVYPVFVLDPWFLAPDPSAPSPGSARVGINRIQFLLESLQDLDRNLSSRGSKLLLVHGNPIQVIPELLDKWRIRKLCFEFDTEPYALDRDAKIKEHAKDKGIELHCSVSHTIFNPDLLIAKNGGKAPLTFQSFCKNLVPATKPIGNGPSSIPPTGDLHGIKVVPVPTLEELGYTDFHEDFSPFRGGETVGLTRLEDSLANEKWVCEFEKPKGDPTAFIKPATTVLSPYLKFGCLSSRLFYSRVKEVYSRAKSFTSPPVSLEAQLLWREFFYTAAYATANFDKMVGNPTCKQIPWKDDDELLSAWRDGRTGYPWIDAAMTQLRKWGWMHHLARHAVACFLTRGDMFVYWEKGRDVFDRLLIDADWSINNGNWLWLSASAFFNQYHRIYSPITFAKKYDRQGNYIKHFLPVIKDMPQEFIYEPWKAPVEIQRKAKCIIGKDYPTPVLDHAVASKICRERMGAAYALSKSSHGNVSQEQVDELQDTLTDVPTSSTSKNKRQKQSRITDYSA
ncbi:(6-4)DNA photolyase [Selaginella moellendorffii]|uniref:(6-4)DNA photolyase n=1 Tax=Selaginella moellendorffii TaxID=88036 RepID=UPI000D1D0CA2|nr:(6-4)DNA photolyase [Selaginella moellendorffii]|eukprot:XP_024538612.1 (6-4)DNA photolyase [Selaginella moellendorffii]